MRRIWVLALTDHDPPDVIGLDKKNTAMPLASSKTITDDVTLTLPYAYAYIFIRDFFWLYQN